MQAHGALIVARKTRPMYQDYQRFNNNIAIIMWCYLCPDSVHLDFGALQIIYFLTYLIT